MPALLLAAVLLVGSSAAETATPSVQEILLRAKPAVALVVSEVAAEVSFGCAGLAVTVTPPPFRETGTGWFIASSGWVITNGHVVSAGHRPSADITDRQLAAAIRSGCLPKLLEQRGFRPSERADLEDQLLRQTTAASRATAQGKLDPSLSVILSNGVRLPATVAKYSPPVAGEEMSGQDLALLKVDAADMPSLGLTDSASAKIGDRLHILGFPGVVLSHELLSASAKAEASVTSGAISGFKQDRAGQAVIQTDAPAAWGNSGGPAITDQGGVIGVLTFVTLDTGGGGTVQGFNFVIPSQAVRDFLRGTPVALGERSRFNDEWYAALADYFGGRPTSAARHLAEANRLLPELPDVKRLAAENDERVKHPPPRAVPWRSVASAIVVLAGAGLASLWVQNARRTRFLIRPPDVARMLENADAPVILDARDDDTYSKSPVRLPNAVHVPSTNVEHGLESLGIAKNRTVVAYCT
jgi:S1-C subfamily serine protease